MALILNRIDVASFCRWLRVIALMICFPLLGCASLNPAEYVSPRAKLKERSTRVEVQSLEFDWLDLPRKRAVPARLYWPLQTANQRVPLIVFSHGIGGSRAGYGYLGQYWASQGYASLHVQHIGSDRGLWCCNPFTLVARLRAAASENEAVARAQDVKYALNQLLEGSRGGQIDVRRLVVAGHSYGANTALLLAGAKVAPVAGTTQLHEPRFSAAILMSSPPFYGREDLNEILSGVQIPTLHITTTEDVIRIPGYESSVSDRINVFDSTASHHKVLAVFEGGSHSVFTSRPLTGGVFLNPKIKEATRSLSLAFLRRNFNQDELGLTDWRADHLSLLASYIER